MLITADTSTSLFSSLRLVLLRRLPLGLGRDERRLCVRRVGEAGVVLVSVIGGSPRRTNALTIVMDTTLAELCTLFGT